MSDLITLQNPVTDDDIEIENILKSVQLDSRENVDLKKVVTTIKSYAYSNSEKLQVCLFV